jgi:hypothetical protein
LTGTSNKNYQSTESEKKPKREQQQAEVLNGLAQVSKLCNNEVLCNSYIFVV